MFPTSSGQSEDDDPHDALRRIELHVQRVPDLDSFHFSRREDGRFHCSLEKLIGELTASETRQVLDTLGSLSEALRRHLEEIS